MRDKKGRAAHLFWDAVDAAPIAIPAGLAAFGVIAIVLLIFGQFYNVLVWPLGLVAAGVTMWLVGKYTARTQSERPSSKKERRICDIIVLILVLSWVGFNALYTSQHIYTNRDPATYGVAGAWLVDNEHLRIEIPTIFGDESTLPTSAGFGVNKKEGDQLFAQGMHLLPALLGLGGRIVGDGAMLHLSPIFGGTALLALYGFARLIVRARWAVVATAAFAASLPLLYFSRDTYTEPLAATFTFGALSLLWVAMKTKQLSMWFLTGVVLGAGALTRIDAYLSMSAFAAFLVILLALAPKQERVRTLQQAGLLAAGAAIVALIAWFDLSQLSYGYYMTIQSRFYLQFVPLALVAVLGIVVVTLAWKSRLLSYLDRTTKPWRSPAAAALVVAIAAVLISRPLWFVGHHDADLGLVEGLQEAAGMAIDGTRDYAEITTNWIAWYIGPVLGILAIGGIAIAVARAMKDKSLMLVAFLLVFIATAAVFLNKPSITPDQIWASRRLLPIILPGVALLGVIALDWLSRVKPRYLYGADGKIIAAVLATLGIVAPLATSMPFLTERTNVPQLQQVQATCDMLPEDAAVMWTGIARLNATQTTRSFCDVPAVGVGQPEGETFINMAQEARSNGYTPIVGVFGNQAGLIPEEYLPNMTETSAIIYHEYNHYLTQPPDGMMQFDRSVLIGEVQPDGSITRIERE